MARLSIAFCLLILLTFSTARADAPSLNDLQTLWKQHDFNGIVKGATDALAPGGTTDPGDRFKIAMLKGEAQLQLRQSDAAVDAFTAAAKETQDAKQVATATATEILISRSPNFIYTSLTIKPPPKPSPVKVSAHPIQQPVASTTATTKPAVLLPGQFDIIDSVHRTGAMAALWTDERTATEKLIKDKIAAKTLPAVKEGIDLISKSEPISIAAGYGDWAQGQRDLLVNAVRRDVNGTMKDMNTQLIAITKNQVKRRNTAHPKPMPQGERDQLNLMSQNLDQISQALKALPHDLNVEDTTYQPEIDHAAQLQDRATTVLATD